LILASDGVWEFMSNKEVIDFALRKGRSKIKEISTSIVKEAWTRWIEREGSVDDVTCLIMFLEKKEDPPMVLEEIAPAEDATT
jgi:serine/threonine protein phosphatase PrpC